VLHAELGSARLSFLTAMADQHPGIVTLKSIAKFELRKGGKYLDTKGRMESMMGPC